MSVADYQLVFSSTLSNFRGFEIVHDQPAFVIIKFFTIRPWNFDCKLTPFIQKVFQESVKNFSGYVLQEETSEFIVVQFMKVKPSHGENSALSRKKTRRLNAETITLDVDVDNDSDNVFGHKKKLSADIQLSSTLTPATTTTTITIPSATTTTPTTTTTLAAKQNDLSLVQWQSEFKTLLSQGLFNLAYDCYRVNKPEMQDSKFEEWKPDEKTELKTHSCNTVMCYDIDANLLCTLSNETHSRMIDVTLESQVEFIRCGVAGKEVILSPGHPAYHIFCYEDVGDDGQISVKYAPGRICNFELILESETSTFLETSQIRCEVSFLKTNHEFLSNAPSSSGKACGFHSVPCLQTLDGEISSISVSASQGPLHFYNRKFLEMCMPEYVCALNEALKTTPKLSSWRKPTTISKLKKSKQGMFDGIGNANKLANNWYDLLQFFHVHNIFVFQTELGAHIFKSFVEPYVNFGQCCQLSLVLKIMSQYDSIHIQHNLMNVYCDACCRKHPLCSSFSFRTSSSSSSSSTATTKNIFSFGSVCGRRMAYFHSIGRIMLEFREWRLQKDHEFKNHAAKTIYDKIELGHTNFVRHENSSGEDVVY